MADFTFDLVSPERRLARMDVTEVQIPGADGDMTAMAHHSPTITTLRPGILAVIHSGGTSEYVVSGGFAEITATGVSVLAEKAFLRTEAKQEHMDKLVSDAVAALEAAKQSDIDVDEAELALYHVSEMARVLVD
ncbi:MAG: F-type H+-transporting ATPase subunit epsilon [Octadecabacter sp.]|jgi:F-type H+-transporting ATPase subunit epsilon